MAAADLRRGPSLRLRGTTGRSSGPVLGPALEAPAAPRLSRAGALGGAAALGAGALALAAWPWAARAVPPCPFHAVTGLDCPGCGATRAVIALARGDVPAAVGHNAVMVLLALPLAVWLWSTWVRERPAPAVFGSRLFLPVVAAVLVVFTVVRNLGVEPFQALAA